MALTEVGYDFAVTPDETSLSTLLAVAGAPVAETAVAEAATLCGIDSHRMRLLLKRKGLTVLARTTRSADAVPVLRKAGVRSAALTTDEIQDAPRPALAGGVTRDASGRVVLRVHGKPAGAPAGVPLLLVFGDLAAVPEGPSVISARKPDTFGQRILRAAFPVVDLVWAEGRIRIGLSRMTWTGLPGRGFSRAANLQMLLRILTEQAAGVVLDDGFEAQELSLGPLLVAGENLEGADRERVVRFERYALAAIAAWKSRLYPEAGPGQIATLGGAPTPAAEFFSRRPIPAAPIPLPWIRGGGRSRVRSGIWPFLLGIPLLGGVFDTHGDGAPGFVIAALVIAGGGGLAYGLRALRRRERLRSVLPGRIRSMALGAVQLSGKVVPCFPLMAPYARVRCGWYRLELRTREEGESDQDYWIRSSERSGSGDMPFWLEDSTAAVLIQPAGAEVDVEPQRTSVDSQTEAVEWILAEGQTVFVRGFAQRRSTDTAPAPPVPGRSVPERDEVFVGSGPDEPIVITASSRGGERSAMSRDFFVGVVLGGLYLLGALVLLIQRLSS